ncbi:diphthamide synthesis protein [Candidatus Pacearchaeota archaeon]|nr:diphthamide synthesis protein [Candidatus Pacearchaeota archaeon]
METLFIPAKSKLKLNKKKAEEISKKLPKNIAIAYSIQYESLAFEIKNILSKKHKITKSIQVLGCSKPNLPKNTQAILLISSGKFHAMSLASETKLPVYILEHNSFSKISDNEINEIEKRQKVAYLKFLHANKIGILVSTKPGQQNLKRAIEISKKIKDKKSYLFISNNLDVNEFENFGLSSWINTACPRLDMNSNSIINMNKLNLA